MDLVPGSYAGPFRIIGPLGRGGMASVYRAYEAALDRYVALKVLPREFLHDPGFAERFQREAKAIAKLEHPNIVPIYAYDIDRSEGIPWMALRLIGGGSLAQLVTRGPLGARRVVAILRGVADALDYAHGKGIVHRDVKPQNVLLDESDRVYLADFGIAKILESAGGLTATGVITGTPQYMAPEQAIGGRIGPAVDVYATGIMAYEMLTGHAPFAADTPVAIMMKHVQEPLPTPPPEAVAEPLLEAIRKCTSKRPEERWPGAGAFVSALERGLASPKMAGPAVVPTIALAPPVAPTAVSAPRAIPPPTVAWRPPAARSTGAAGRPGLGTRGLAAVAGGAGLLLAGGVGIALVLLRGGEEPAPSPSPPLAAEATVTGSAPARPTRAPAPLPTVTPAAAPRGPTSSEVSAEARGAPPVAVPPTPVPTPVATPTPDPARPGSAEPAAPEVDPEVQRLAAALSDREASTRRRAGQDLAALGPAAAPALPALSVALSDPDADVRLRAAEALGQLGPAGRSSVPALARALRDVDPMVRGEAAKSLGLHGEAAAAAAEPLGESLRDPEVAVRREAARALARMGRGAEPALRDLVEALRDKDRTVKSQAARALGGVGPTAREAVPALNALSRDSDLIVSREARAALQSIEP